MGERGEWLEYSTSPVSDQVLFFFSNLSILFIYFWLHWVFVAARGLSLVAASGHYSLLQCTGFSCCGARALGTRALVVARGL